MPGGKEALERPRSLRKGAVTPTGRSRRSPRGRGHLGESGKRSRRKVVSEELRTSSTPGPRCLQHVGLGVGGVACPSLPVVLFWGHEGWAPDLRRDPLHRRVVLHSHLEVNKYGRCGWVGHPGLCCSQPVPAGTPAPVHTPAHLPACTPVLFMSSQCTGAPAVAAPGLTLYKWLLLQQTGASS